MEESEVKSRPQGVWVPIVDYGPAEIYRSKDGSIGWAYHKANHEPAIRGIQRAEPQKPITEAQIASLLFQIENQGAVPQSTDIPRIVQEKKGPISLITAALE
ncbi:hypothetical protein HYX08_05600 [Candidatus Woesearchaeota archaeon]|nr:hypothetical protein [Candidatus Woesearchaeota archaeon]